MRNAGAVGDHHIVEQIAEVGLVDLRGALHRLRGEADFVADQLGAGRDLALGDFGRDRIGVVDGNAGPGLGQLNGLFALLRRGHENIGGLVTIGVRHHGSAFPLSDGAALRERVLINRSRAAVGQCRFSQKPAATVADHEGRWGQDRTCQTKSLDHNPIDRTGSW